MNLEKAVGTTDDTDEEEVALERAFTQRVSAEEVPALRESGHIRVIRGFSTAGFRMNDKFDGPTEALTQAVTRLQRGLNRFSMRDDSPAQPA